MFRLGWQVLRERSRDALDAGRVRRAAWISAASAAVVLGGLVALQLAFAWAAVGPVRTTSTLAFSAIAAGLVVFAAFPTKRRPAASEMRNGRQVRPDDQRFTTGPVQQYLGRKPRAIAPEDRAAVLREVPRLQRALVRVVCRFAPLTAGLFLGGLAVLSAGGFRAWPTLWTMLYVFMVPSMIVQLGRAERARLAALATPEPPPSAERPGRRRDPAGSKVRLPGE